MFGIALLGVAAFLYASNCCLGFEFCGIASELPSFLTGWIALFCKNSCFVSTVVLVGAPYWPVSSTGRVN